MQPTTCQQITRKSASTLALAFVLLPRERRDAMSALYAFCREVDDVVDDESRPSIDRQAELNQWREDIRLACTGGAPRLPVNRELQPIIDRYNLPLDLFEELIRGVAESALLQLTGGLEVNVAEYWMLRIVDVKSALLARGYPALHARVALRVEDELLPDNTGTYQLSVDDGSMAIEHSTGEGDAALDVRALAPLYTGFQNASSLAELGLLRGTGEAVRTLDALFAGPAPGLADYF
jgi:hypothetical protein